MIIYRKLAVLALTASLMAPVYADEVVPDNNGAPTAAQIRELNSLKNQIIQLRNSFLPTATLAARATAKSREIHFIKHQMTDAFRAALALLQGCGWLTTDQYFTIRAEVNANRARLDRVHTEFGDVVIRINAGRQNADTMINEINLMLDTNNRTLHTYRSIANALPAMRVRVGNLRDLLTRTTEEVTDYEERADRLITEAVGIMARLALQTCVEAGGNIIEDVEGYLDGFNAPNGGTNQPPGSKTPMP